VTQDWITDKQTPEVGSEAQDKIFGLLTHLIHVVKMAATVLDLAHQRFQSCTAVVPHFSATGTSDANTRSENMGTTHASKITPTKRKLLFPPIDVSFSRQ
jgi:hypothetical protein